MALASGTRFGSYEVTEAIGAGGMGEVYRATDTALERDVALKVLPASFAEDADRVTRFEREAKTLAALNHPNIAQIHGLEKTDGTTALVMELVDGVTLEERIAKGPIPADEALGIAMQIADALEAAHGQSIVHRDLKPANIKLKQDGTVKVLDFGIAKALAPEALTSEPQSPIMTTPATQVGVILGTAAYMSPEQAKGKAIDQRTDIWAFGCVLYEMLTGQLAFGAEDVPTTLARIIDRDTDLDTLPAVVSPGVRQTIKLCLEKDVRERLADIRDVRLILKGALDVSSRTSDTDTVAQPLWRRALPTAAAVTVAVIVTAIAIQSQTQIDPRPINRFDDDFPAGGTLQSADWNVLAYSRDGRSIVYNMTDGIYLRRFGELEPRLIPGTEETSLAPVFSPDGQYIAYGTTSSIKRVSINGGGPLTVAQITPNCGLSWETADWIVACANYGIYRVRDSGGELELIVPPSGDEVLEGARFLPDGDSVLFTAARPEASSWDSAQIVAYSLSTGERTVLLSGGADARYLPSGHLLYAFEDGLFAIAFDLDTLTVSGPAVRFAEGVMRATGGPYGYSANYGISDEGTLVYVEGDLNADARTLVWVTRDGREEPIAAPLRSYVYPRISPDGTKVALDIRDQELDIWTWDLVRQTLTRFTFDPGEDEFPVWSPDGQRIVFSSGREGGSGGDTDAFWRAADGAGGVERLAESSNQIFPTAFFLDATGFVVRVGDNVGNSDDIGVVYFEGNGQPEPLLATQFNERNPDLSPDGRWIAYVSDESGDEEVYVRPFPDVDAGRWQVSTNGGREPLWAADGTEMFYRDGESMMVVPIEIESTFIAGTPQPLFEDRYMAPGLGRTYDVSADGQRFMMIKAAENQSEPPKIVIVENWLDELERLVPTN